MLICNMLSVMQMNLVAMMCDVTCVMQVNLKDKYKNLVKSGRVVEVAREFADR